MSDVSLGPGWWRASDGKWYPPESSPATDAAAAAGGDAPTEAVLREGIEVGPYGRFADADATESRLAEQGDPDGDDDPVAAQVILESWFSERASGEAAT